MVWMVQRGIYRHWRDRFYDEAASYMEVQLWAKSNTQVNALFMVDPTHYYGWRDFSGRSSFGNLREWGYGGIVYSSDELIYHEGIKRMLEFGIDISKVSSWEIDEFPGFPYGRVLNDVVRKRFYGFENTKLIDLFNRYGINYIVMNKEYHKKEFCSLKIAYENSHFIVYKL